MHLSLWLLPTLTSLAQAISFNHETATKAESSWPYTPFVTSGRDIKNTQNESVIFAGVNWPGAADAMIPEGLQYQSVATIMTKIKSLGVNVIRLTYAIEMIDDIYEGKDGGLKTSLINALGESNGTKVLARILDKNEGFTENTTRLEVFDAVAAEAYAQKIYIHLDNHVSKAEWCCSHTDGNAWFSDTDFNTTTWKRGLSYMSSHAKSWPAFTSMSLRNELRSTDPETPSSTSPYNWETWYTNMVSAAEAIFAANTSPLIFFSGLDYDTDLAPVVNGEDLGAGTVFKLDDFDFADKLVWELHNYDNDATSCSSITSALYNGGYNAMNASATVANRAPVVLTEFGFGQDEATVNGVYAQCFKEYLPALEGGAGGWMQWVVSGSYYIREGGQDKDESWGLFNHDWSDWRDEAAVEYTKEFVGETLA